MNLTTEHLRGLVQAISETIRTHRDELNRLDAAAGDGDHGTGISAGFAAAAQDVTAADTPAAVLQAAAMALMNRTGGSAGALYGTLFLKAAMHVQDQPEIQPVDFAAMWDAGGQAVMQRGRAQRGDKTLLDALLPAAEALRAGIDAGEPLPEALRQAAAAAEAGARATADMQARHGRARYAGERAVGHVDAGAQSMALMFRAMYEYVEELPHGDA